MIRLGTSRPLWSIPAAGVVFLFATPAQAHLNATGLGPVYDGLIHFLTSPEDLAAVLALALLSGLRGADYGRRALFTVPAAWLLGGLLGLLASSANSPAVLSAAWLLVLGGLVALDARLSLRVTTALAGLLGLYHGYFNGAGLGESATAAEVLIGLVSAIFVLTAISAACVVRLQAPWSRVAVRVVGSWIAASGVLMLAWALRAV